MRVNLQVHRGVAEMSIKRVVANGKQICSSD